MGRNVPELLWWNAILPLPPIRAGTQSYASYGSYTFTVPKRVRRLKMTITPAQGGGGAAGGGALGPGGRYKSYWRMAGSGGAGDAPAGVTQTLTVSPGDSITVTIGEGGKGALTPFQGTFDRYSTDQPQSNGFPGAGGREDGAAGKQGERGNSVTEFADTGTAGGDGSGGAAGGARVPLGGIQLPESDSELYTGGAGGGQGGTTSIRAGSTTVMRAGGHGGGGGSGALISGSRTRLSLSNRISNDGTDAGNGNGGAGGAGGASLQTPRAASGRNGADGKVLFEWSQEINRS